MCAARAQVDPNHVPSRSGSPVPRPGSEACISHCPPVIRHAQDWDAFQCAKSGVSAKGDVGTSASGTRCDTTNGLHDRSGRGGEASTSGGPMGLNPRSPRNEAH